MTKTLILGGVKSGKSRFAEQWATATGLSVHYIATAKAEDTEMQQRITRHRQQRPDHWLTIEEPMHLAARLKHIDASANCILIDCLTLWLTNLLIHHDPHLLEQEIAEFIALLPEFKANLIIVSNETNMGIVPMGELSRRYCDEVGVLHQRIASLSDNVILTVAGLPHPLKGQLHDKL